MPTIKRKVEKNLPQLIEWGWENGIEKRSFKSNGGKVIANFEDMGHFITDNFVSSDVTFTVEIEEPITEDTVISEMLTIYDEGITHLTNNKSLNDLIENNLKSAYIMNDDLRLILIWRDGKLVE